MYIYNYMHIWRAARNVKITPANNYDRNCDAGTACSQLLSSTEFSLWC